MENTHLVPNAFTGPSKGSLTVENGEFFENFSQRGGGGGADQKSEISLGNFWVGGEDEKIKINLNVNFDEKIYLYN